VFLQTFDDPATAALDAAAELLHIRLARLPPGRNAGFRRFQVLLAR